jgi:competence protein ComEC
LLIIAGKRYFRSAVAPNVSSIEKDEQPCTTRTVVPLAVALTVGIAANRIFPINPGLWLIFSGVLWAAAAMVLRRPRAFAVCALAAVGLLGTTSAQLSAFYFPRDHIALFAGDEPRLATVEARVDEAPQIIPSPHGKNGAGRMDFQATAVRILTTAGWEKGSGTLRVSIGQEVPGIFAGGVVRLTGLLQRPLPADNPGQFDWSHYGRTQRSLAELSVSHASGAAVLEGGEPAVASWLRQHTRIELDAGFPLAAGADRELLAALVFGDRGKELASTEEAFRRTGTAHLLASNGLRIGVLAGGLYLLCVLLRRSPRACAWLVTLAVVLFAFVTLPTPQALRPALLCVAVGIALGVRRKVDSVQLLSLAALLILAVNPLDFYNAGFQLSFVTVFGLMVFAAPVTRWLGELENPHLRVARSLEQNSSWRRLRITVWDRGRQLFAVAVVAWLIAAPLVAFSFEQFNPWSVPIGVALSPLVFVAMIAGFLKLLLTLALPWFAGDWARIAQVPAALLNHAVLLFAALPGDDVPLTAPPAWVVGIYYLLLCAPALASFDAFKSRWNRVRPLWLPQVIPRWSARIGFPALALLLLFLNMGPQVRPPRGSLQLTLLSVGAGQTAVVELPDGNALLIDCGSTTLSDDLRQCLAPFLRHEGRSQIEAIYLSHGDYDHISAAAGAATAYDVPNVFISPNFRVHARESAAAEGLLESLDELKRPAQTLWLPQHLPLGSGAALDVLWPPESTDMNSNNSALVLKLSYAGRSILFPADIQVPAERGLLQRASPLRSDILIAPHHGSCEESTADFIAAVHPQFILASNARRLTQKQRAFDQLQTAHPLYRTSQCGALTVTIDAKGKIELRGFLRLREEAGGEARRHQGT